MTPNSADTSEEPPIAVQLRPAGSRFAAIVTLCGEHDLATAPEVARTLAGISGSVLVDLSRCEFIDSTVIGALITAAQTLARDGHSLELLAPRENATINRTLRISGVDQLLPVHHGRPDTGESE